MLGKETAQLFPRCIAGATALSAEASASAPVYQPSFATGPLIAQGPTEYPTAAQASVQFSLSLLDTHCWMGGMTAALCTSNEHLLQIRGCQCNCNCDLNMARAWSIGCTPLHKCHVQTSKMAA